jgi:hypothetical protein
VAAVYLGLPHDRPLSSHCAILKVGLLRIDLGSPYSTNFIYFHDGGSSIHGFLHCTVGARHRLVYHAFKSEAKMKEWNNRVAFSLHGKRNVLKERFARVVLRCLIVVQLHFLEFFLASPAFGTLLRFRWSQLTLLVA